MKPPLEQNYYELLEVPRDATTAELDRAYDRAKAFYGVGSIAVYSLAAPEELKQVQDRIDEAYLILGDEKARAEYDARVGPPSPDERPLHREVREAREKEAAKEADAKARAEAEAKAKPEVDAKPEAKSEPAAAGAEEPKPEEKPSDGTVSEAAPQAAESKADPGAPAPEPPAPAVEEKKAEAPVAPLPPAEPRPVTPPPVPAAVARVEPVVPPAEAVPASEPSPVPAPPAPVAPAAIESPILARTTPAPVAAEVRLDLTVRPEEKRESRAEPGPQPPPPMEAPEPSPRSSARRDSKPPERVLPKSPEVPADAVFNGEFLRKLRETHGLTVQELSDRTKIGKAHLENIEADRYGSLPPLVYLRGFLMSYARELRLDPVRVSKSYLEQHSKGDARPKG